MIINALPISLAASELVESIQDAVRADLDPQTLGIRSIDTTVQCITPGTRTPSYLGAIAAAHDAP